MIKMNSQLTLIFVEHVRLWKQWGERNKEIIIKKLMSNCFFPKLENCLKENIKHSNGESQSHLDSASF